MIARIAGLVLGLALLSRFSSFGATVLQLPVCDLDTLYPNQCNAGGCWPSFIPDTAAPCGKCLGFTGSTVHVGFRGVHLPSNPVKIVVDFASPVSTSDDFYLDSLTGIFFWTLALPATDSRGGWSTYRKDTTTLDYTLLPAGIDLSGTHDIFISFNEIGNYRSFTFIFDDSKTQDRLVSPGNSAAQARGIGLVNFSGGDLNRVLTDKLIAGAFDLRGRRLLIRAMPQGIGAKLTGPKPDGIAVVQWRD
jgi:hypothetical protein